MPRARPGVALLRRPQIERGADKLLVDHRRDRVYDELDVGVAGGKPVQPQEELEGNDCAAEEEQASAHGSIHTSRKKNSRKFS